MQVGHEDNFAPYNQVNKLLSTIRSKLEHLHARAAVTQVTKTLAYLESDQSPASKLLATLSDQC